MQEAFILGFGLLFPVLAALIIWYLVQVRRVEKRLKISHPEKYSELGEPHLIWNNSIRNNFRFLGFLRDKDYLRLNDPDLENLCHSCGIAFVLSSAALVLMVVLLVGAVVFW